MNSEPSQYSELSSWWFTGFLATFASLVGLMVAVNAGEIRTFSLYYLMGLFVVCGAMLTTIIVNAVGIGKKWELAKNSFDEESKPAVKTPQGSLLSQISQREPRRQRTRVEPQLGTDFLHVKDSLEATPEPEADIFMARRRQPRRRA